MLVSQREIPVLALVTLKLKTSEDPIVPEENFKDSVDVDGFFGIFTGGTYLSSFPIVRRSVAPFIEYFTFNGEMLSPLL
uniref:Peptidase A1 domain-containing protein n=1 Tax=Caenorhabditis tropicalis TaxID=1561998 RepID=A0A1I7UIF9_9PELO